MPSRYTLLTRTKAMKQEDRLLAPYAQKNSSSRGRKHKQLEHDLRTDFQRDRDRVVHSRSFRRLEYKTQVFLNGTGDHLRTRLTHTIEVAAIARTFARGLRLNEDLAEAIALAHDMGHSPFGHAGENVLNDMMKEHGGFEHNHQSLRIVEYLEKKYPQFDGLNLTWEVREGLAKHHSSYNKKQLSEEFPFTSFSLEAQTADLADEIAYYSHDIDDGLEAGLLKGSDLYKLDLFGKTAREIKKSYPELETDRLHYFTIRGIINKQVQDAINYSINLIRDKQIKSSDEVRETKQTFIRYSSKMKKQANALRLFLFQKLYNHPRVQRANDFAVRMLQKLFLYYLEEPAKLKPMYKKRIPEIGTHRAVCDYISGMTDRYVILEHQRIFKSKSPNLALRSLK